MPFATADYFCGYKSVFAVSDNSSPRYKKAVRSTMMQGTAAGRFFSIVFANVAPFLEA